MFAALVSSVAEVSVKPSGESTTSEFSSISSLVAGAPAADPPTPGVLGVRCYLPGVSWL